MSCTFPAETIALHVEGDLPAAAADKVASHLVACEQCSRLFAQLRASQSMLKSLRLERVSAAECCGMRRGVMALIAQRRDEWGWAGRIERAIAFGFRQRSYAVVALALGIVSVSLLAQLRPGTPGGQPDLAVFAGANTLVRPQGYREWIAIATPAAARRVYINPSGYREFARTGRFPDGTLLVWESLDGALEATDRPHRPSSTLLVSVKDSRRFDSGWGFFDFTGQGTASAQALPDSSGCNACHRRDAATDHVFTQFYPELRSARHGALLPPPRGRPILAPPRC